MHWNHDLSLSWVLLVASVNEPIKERSSELIMMVWMERRALWRPVWPSDILLQHTILLTDRDWAASVYFLSRTNSSSWLKALARMNLSTFCKSCHLYFWCIPSICNRFKKVMPLVRFFLARSSSWISFVMFRTTASDSVACSRILDIWLMRSYDRVHTK